ncbi:polysaccharide deacetylase family protein [Shinella sp.]|uniref:polysaccharide deacetylase family protein n=1 Tax=Shinella sp. TaxID=1870904 RepID=UPI002590617D|nr:polysaccharide deacetylase family protein [Shinella sp.]MCW5710746.1 polysaccharide deacetylase family protein [Shinella sp.]
MTLPACARPLTEEIARRAAAGRPLRLWLRDDDAVAPTAALDTLLALTARHAVPVLIAVIPAFTGAALAARLAEAALARVAVHGWAHENHAGPGEKSQELGTHRPAEAVLAELGQGFERLSALHAGRFVPMLVPPWNRIAPAVVDGLPSLGFKALSVFGPEKPAPLAVCNTHVDIIDWRGTRGARPAEAVIADLVRVSQTHDGPIGLLTHHLVHDAAAWALMALIFEATAGQAGCVWERAEDLVA